jgi:hypothetical protein
MEKFDKLYESFETQAIAKDDMKKIVESGEVAIPERMLGTYMKIAQLNEEAILNETINVTADITNYTKNIQPLLRRIVPGLLAMDVTGVQPVDGPDSAVWVIKSNYAGSENKGVDVKKSIVVTVTGNGTLAVDDNVTGATSGATGTVKYVETGKAIIEVASGTFVAGETIKTDVEVVNVYSSESSFRQVLKNYSGPYTTGAGEVLGKDMNQLKVTIDKMQVQVKTRALKAQFTHELVQDMQKMFGANAEQELNTFLATEITLEMDREVIEKYKAIATANPDFAVATPSNSQGRWNVEMYAGLYQKIMKLANGLASKNRRGKGNILITTASVITALESLNAFKTTDYNSNVKASENPSQLYVATLKNGMKVYQDFFSDDEYALVIYKGQNAMDAGVIYSPYIALWFANATDPSTLQPVIGAKTRYALTANTILDDGAGSNYAEYMKIDLSNTPVS